MERLIQYYNKFNEEKRLDSRHGFVEFTVSMHVIHQFLEKMDNPKILDIGAGTGKYSVALANEGYDVTAVELVKSNLGTLKAKKSTVKAYQGNALDLKRFKDDSFDLTLLFGPMYHLFEEKDKIQALNEAKRVTKQDGVILVAYVMNDYSILTYGFVEGHIKECIEKGKIDEQFHTHSTIDDLYSYVRIEDIDDLNEKAGLNRVKMFAVDGAANYMRPVLKKMDEETFELFLKYQLSVCERSDMMGASSHVIDVIKK